MSGMGRAFYKHYGLRFPDGVYEPLDDSFLLADQVKVEAGSTVLDLGCGAGLVSLIAAHQGANVTAADINKKALQAATENCRAYGHQIETVETDMFLNISGKYDYVFFNPPYLPHEDMDDQLAKKHPELAKSWDGGAHGRRYIDTFLTQYKGHLNPGGKAYLLNSSLNDITKTQEKLDKQGVKYAIVARTELFFEKLYVFEITG
ncbi:MAG: methyltransferase [DPANN group archaeon]|nr:methyltransferase [DPANN group archaeon]